MKVTRINKTFLGQWHRHQEQHSHRRTPKQEKDLKKIKFAQEIAIAEINRFHAEAVKLGCVTPEIAEGIKTAEGIIRECNIQILDVLSGKKVKDLN